jgi:hypothetical protein
MIRQCVLFFPHFHSQSTCLLMSSICTLYSPVNANRRFGGTCHLYFQGVTENQTRKQREVGIKLAACASTLKMEATCSYETSVDFLRTAWCYTSEDITLHTHSCENLKSCIIISCLSFLSLFLPVYFLSLLI